MSINITNYALSFEKSYRFNRTDGPTSGGSQGNDGPTSGGSQGNDGSLGETPSSEDDFDSSDVISTQNIQQDIEFEYLKFISDQKTQKTQNYISYITKYNLYNKKFEEEIRKVNERKIFNYKEYENIKQNLRYYENNAPIRARYFKRNDLKKYFSEKYTFEESTPSCFLLDSSFVKTHNINNKLENIPFYNQFYFSSNKRSLFFKFLKKNNLETYFLTFLKDISKETEITNTNYLVNILNLKIKNKEDVKELNNNLSNFNLKNFPFSSFFKYLRNINQDINIGFDDISDGSALLSNKEQPDLRLLKNNLFRYAITQNVKSNLNLFLNDRIDEIIAYELEKFSIEDNRRVFLDNTIFLNSNEEYYKLIDTQIINEKEYFYNLYAYKLIYIKEINSFYIVKAPIAETISVVVRDSYPYPPLVNIQLEKNLKNSIFFKFDKLIGSSKEKFITFNGEKTKFDYNFRNDDLKSFYIIYRTEKEPTSYGDFNLEYKRINENIFIDTIELNKDYYYTIRTVDIHNKISNPSPVYKVRIVGDEESSFIQNSIYAYYKNFIDLNDKSDKSWYIYNNNLKKDLIDRKEISFKRYLQISPAIVQTLIKNLNLGTNITDYDKSLDEEIFGEEAADPQINNHKSIIGKKYKIRIKSKNSNRYIDLNFEYKVNKKQ